MTKADIIKMVAEKTGFHKNKSTDLVKQVFELVKTTLESGENLKIPGFGSFVLIKKNDRPGRNPHTGEEVIITARKILTFRPSELLKLAVNNKKNNNLPAGQCG